MEFKVEEQQRDNRGPYERLLPEAWDHRFAEHLAAHPQSKRLEALRKVYTITERQAVLVDGCYQTAARAMMEVFGRAVDEVNDNEGMRCVAFAVTLEGMRSVIESLVHDQNLMVMQACVMGEVQVSPGCDCIPCRFGELMNSSLRKRDKALGI